MPDPADMPEHLSRLVADLNALAAADPDTLDWLIGYHVPVDLAPWVDDPALPFVVSDNGGRLSFGALGLLQAVALPYGWRLVACYAAGDDTLVSFKAERSS
jgi:hypothetical protein